MTATENIEAARRVVVDSSRSFIAFGCWLFPTIVLIRGTPFAPFARTTVLIASGIYMVTTWPTTYCRLGSLLCLSLLTWAVQILTRGKMREERTHEFILGSWARPFGIVAKRAKKILMDMIPSKSPFWSETQRYVEQMKHFAILHLTGASRDVAIFLCWYPITFSLGTILRVTSLIVTFSCIHCFFILWKVKNEEPTSLLTLWVSICRSLHRQRAAIFATSILLILFFWIVPSWILTMQLVSVGAWISTTIWNDSTLQHEVMAILAHCRGLFPAEVHLIEMMRPYLWPFWGPLDEMVRCQLPTLDLKRHTLHVLAGALLGFLLSLICTFSNAAALSLFVPVCAIPLLLKNSKLDITSFILFGLVIFLSLEGLLTGYILVYHLNYPWRWLVFLVYVPLWHLWFWLCLLLAFVQIMPYSGNLQFRKTLFKVWALKERSGNNSGVMIIRVDSSKKDAILPSTLAQIEENYKPLQVVFQGEQGVDMGGLRKQWAALLSRALVVPPRGRFTPLMRRWEEGSRIYDVNYDYVWAERMRHQHGAMAESFRASNKDDADNDDSSTLETYRKLGVLFGLCLMEGLPLLRVGRGFWKLILQDGRASSTSAPKEEEQQKQKQKLTWEDLVELLPKKAVMRDPTMREHCDFTEISLHSEMFPELCTVSTRLKDRDFHPPAEPSQGTYDELAYAILMNHHVRDIREHFKLGFRGVVTCDLGSLFAAREVQDLMGGSAEIDVRDWECHTVYDEGTSRDHPTVRWLWDVLRNTFSQEEVQRFCEFTTGQPTPPHGGFFELTPLFHVKISKTVHNGIFAHTCFNQIELPSGEMDRSAMEMLMKAAISGGNQNFNKG